MASPDDALQEYFRALPDKIKEKVKPVLREQANRLMAAQRAALREQLQPPDETGGLDASIRAEDGSHDLEVVVLAGGESTTTNGFDRALGFEFGTSHQPARPFFYPPYRTMRDDIQQKIADVVEEAIK